MAEKRVSVRLVAEGGRQVGDSFSSTPRPRKNSFIYVLC